MRKFYLSFAICVIFLLTCLNVGTVYCFPSETIEFTHNNKSFYYQLDSNIKHSSQFDLNYEINKFKRFGSPDDRKNLLKNMLNIGLDKEIALNYIFPNLTNQINSIAKNIQINSRNASISINSQTEKVFHISPEIVGIKVDKIALFDQICNKYLSNEEMHFNIPTQQIEPQITAKDLQPHTNLRSDFSTNISSSSTDRKHNIKNALNTLNKVEIEPNQIFSFNKIVGKRTEENGYREATIIVNNEFVDGLGGGVCQVSSTLYNSALLAGLEIIEANKHSKQVNYVKQGFDAMVNYGSSDLKFKNNTNEKITIITNYSPTHARIRIFGENHNNVTYKLTNEITNIVNPSEEIIIDKEQQYLDKVKFNDEYFYLKKASVGLEIKSFREKYINNMLVSKEVLRHDKYKVQNAIKVFGSIPRGNNILPEEKKVTSATFNLFD